MGKLSVNKHSVSMCILQIKIIAIASAYTMITENRF